LQGGGPEPENRTRLERKTAKTGGTGMTDTHVHIGQFEDVYYEPLEVVDTVMSSGMKGLSFSSTTSCKNNVLYAEIEKEISALLSGMSWDSEIIRPFFWYVLDYIRAGVSIENAVNNIPYKGIKLHPYAHRWDFADTAHAETLHHLFDYAGGHGLPVLIHTGHSGVDSAGRFERFFGEYPQTKCVLAHCRPLDTTIEMLQKYSNVYCDTAFVPPADIRAINNAAGREKIMFGTDFPITHYFNKDPSISLAEQYAKDRGILELCYV
jgi:hypothetical protein